jgi:hypothetical protein
MLKLFIDSIADPDRRKAQIINLCSLILSYFNWNLDSLTL